MQPEKGWEVDLEDLERHIDGNTAALLLNTPAIPVAASTPVNTCWTSWLCARSTDCPSSLMKSMMEW